MDGDGEALRAVEAAVRAERAAHARAHKRGQLLSAVAFSMALAGCSRPLSPIDGGGGGNRDASIALDLGIIQDVPTYEPWHWTAPEVPIRDASCEALQSNPTDAAIFFESDTCFGGCGGAYVTVRFDGEGRVVAVDGVDGGALAPDIVACLLGSSATPATPTSRAPRRR
jgi:hypothetical protein